jgi:hypothetical protein
VVYWYSCSPSGCCTQCTSTTTVEGGLVTAWPAPGQLRVEVFGLPLPYPEPRRPLGGRRDCDTSARSGPTQTESPWFLGGSRPASDGLITLTSMSSPLPLRPRFATLIRTARTILPRPFHSGCALTRTARNAPVL